MYHPSELGMKRFLYGLENREYGHMDPLCWPRDALYPQKLALASSTSGGRSDGIVLWRTKGHGVFAAAYTDDWELIRLRTIAGNYFVQSDRTLRYALRYARWATPADSTLPQGQDVETAEACDLNPRCTMALPGLCRHTQAHTYTRATFTRRMIKSSEFLRANCVYTTRTRSSLVVKALGYKPEERTLPAEGPRFVGEISANFCG
jgi:hypothetical protein